MKKKEHLPEFGVGPFYVATIITLTMIGILLSVFHVIHVGNAPQLKIPFVIGGIMLIVIGIVVYIFSLIQISDHIVKNELVTTGIYSYTRNPIYTSFLMICTGALFVANDLWLLLLPIFYWGILTILMRKTEEKWLHNLYGDVYDDYCKRVNRCIPWKRK